jgi:hypothetical protein
VLAEPGSAGFPGQREIIMKNAIIFWAIVLAGITLGLFIVGCMGWQENVTVQGVAFSRAKVQSDGMVIGELKEDTVIDGRPCKRGWVHLQANGVPVGFTAGQEIDLGRFKIPENTWVIQSDEGVVKVCAFPSDTMVQGQTCSGGGLLGGSEGIQTSFYPDGALKEYFLPVDTVIQNVPCKATVMAPVELYEDGHLEACTIGSKVVQDGRAYEAGARVRLDDKGQIIP